MTSLTSSFFVLSRRATTILKPFGRRALPFVLRLLLILTPAPPLPFAFAFDIHGPWHSIAGLTAMSAEALLRCRNGGAHRKIASSPLIAATVRTYASCLPRKFASRSNMKTLRRLEPAGSGSVRRAAPRGTRSRHTSGSYVRHAISIKCVCFYLSHSPPPFAAHTTASPHDRVPSHR